MKFALTIPLGVLFAHIVEFQHELLHNLAYKSKKTSYVIGLILGMPMLVSFTEYSVWHLLHHKEHGRNNIENFEYDRRKLNGYSFFVSMFSAARILRVIVEIVSVWIGKQRLKPAPKAESTIRAELRLFGIVLLAVGGYSVWTENPIFIWLWLLPLIWAEATHFLIELPEHFGLPEENPDPYTNTRSVTGSWFSRWLTNWNNYHIEHHKHPAAAMPHLTALHQATLERMRSGQPVEVYRGYFKFYADIIRGRLTQTGPTSN